jgi:hypothetical protein
MIDWHHPRIFERLRCFGLALFTLGVASHNVANPPIAVAAIIVSTLLVIRLKIELEIGRDEDQPTFERKLKNIDLINAVAFVPAVFGAIALLRQASGIGMFLAT